MASSAPATSVEETATTTGTYSSAESSFLPTVYFNKIMLENADFQGVQTKHLLPTVGPGECPNIYMEMKPSVVSALQRQRDAYGESCGGATAIIDKNAKGLTVTINLEIKFEFNTTDTSQVILDENLLRFATLSVERSLHADGAHRSDLVYKSLSEYVGSSPDSIDNYSPILTDRGTILLSIPIEVVDHFAADFEPTNLSYHAYCELDMSALSDAYDFEEITTAPASTKGNETGEIVFKNSELVTTAYVYIIEEITSVTEASTSGGVALDTIKFVVPPSSARGRPWSGQVGSIGNYFYTVSTDSAYNHLLLKRIGVPNNTIVDYRLMDKVLNIDLEIVPAKNIVEVLLDSTACEGVGSPTTVLGNWFNDASPYTQDTPTTAIGLSCLKNRRMKINAPEMYLSDVYMSRDHDANCRFLFHLDFDRLIRDKSLFGSLYDGTAKEMIQKHSRILNLKIVRRRVDVEPSVNRLGTPIAGRETNDFNNLTEFIVESSDNPNQTSVINSFTGVNNGKGEIKEIAALQVVGKSVPIHCPNNTCWSGELLENNIRTFSVTDFSIAGKSGGTLKKKNYYYAPTSDHRVPFVGINIYDDSEPPTSPGGIYYQYGIELEVEDGTINFLNAVLDGKDFNFKGLIQIRNQLTDYYGNLEQYNISKHVINKNIAMTLDSSIKFDTVPASIDQIDVYTSMVDSQKPWIEIPAQLSQRVSELIIGTSPAALRPQFEKFLTPTNVTLEQINSMISLVNNLIRKVEDSLGNYRAATPLFYSLKPSGVTRSSERTVMSLNKYFYSIFDASQPRDMYLDILGDQEGTYGSFYKISPSDFTKRANDEIKKNFVSDDPTVVRNKGNLAGKAPIVDPAYGAILDINASKFTFLSPSTISVGSGDAMKVGLIEKGLGVWDITQACMSNGVKGMDKYSSVSAMAVATKWDFVSHEGSSLADNGFEAAKHIFKKLGVSVMTPAIPMCLRANEDSEQTAFIPVADVIGPHDRQVRENLVGNSGGTSPLQNIFEVTQKQKQQEFSNVLPIVQTFINNLGRNGFVHRDPGGKWSNPHKVVPPSMNMEMFDINSDKSIVDRSRKSPPSADEMANLPNCVASLLAADTDATITDLTAIAEPFKNSITAAAMVWNYEFIDRIEVLVGFEKGFDKDTKIGSSFSSPPGKNILGTASGRTASPGSSVTGRPLLRKPIFKKLSGPAALGATGNALPTILESLDNSCILCRLIKEENADIGLVSKSGLDLPILNEYFLLSKGDISSLKTYASVFDFPVAPELIAPFASTNTSTVPTGGGGGGGSTGGGKPTGPIVNVQPTPPMSQDDGAVWKNNPDPSAGGPGGTPGTGEKGDSSTSY